MEREPYILSVRFRCRNPIILSHEFMKRSSVPIVTETMFITSVPNVTFNGVVNSYSLNDDPTRIYSAAWYAKHGVKVLRHDRKGTTGKEVLIYDFLKMLNTQRSK